MNSPLVSVVIPLFNKEKYILSTLNSVIKQDYKNIEIVLIDDGSVDNGFRKAREFLFENKMRFVKIVLETRENKGMTAAKNDGIKLSSGDFIAFLDADDVWCHNKLSEQVLFLVTNHQIDMVLCNHIMLYENNNLPRAVSFLPIERKVVSWLLLTGFGGQTESAALVRRAALIEFGGFNPNLEMWAALDMTFKFSMEGRAGCVPKYLSGYRVLKNGWHNNKQDLISSHNFLIGRMNGYDDYESILRFNLMLYLGFWNLRTSLTWDSLKHFLSLYLKHPIKTSRYLSQTVNRVVFAIARAFFLRRQIRELKGLL